MIRMCKKCCFLISILRLVEKNGTGYTEAEIEQQRDRFCAVYQIIEEAKLETEYEAWKKQNALRLKIYNIFLVNWKKYQK